MLFGCKMGVYHISQHIQCKALFTQQHDSAMIMINGAKQYNHAELGLQSLSTCHVVMLQSTKYT